MGYIFTQLHPMNDSTVKEKLILFVITKTVPSYIFFSTTGVLKLSHLAGDEQTFGDNL